MHGRAFGTLSVIKKCMIEQNGTRRVKFCLIGIKITHNVVYTRYSLSWCIVFYRIGLLILTSNTILDFPVLFHLPLYHNHYKLQY